MSTAHDKNGGDTDATGRSDGTWVAGFRWDRVSTLHARRPTRPDPALSGAARHFSPSRLLVSSGTTASRMWLLSGLAAVLGLVGGGAAVGLFTLIAFLTNLTLLHTVGTTLPTLRGWRPTLWIIPTAVGGALIVSLLARWAPVIRGHGIPESLEAIMTRDSRIKPRAAVAKPLSAAVTIGTGGPFGAEGPVIVTGGSIGSLIGQVLSVSPSERKILLATGAAAGMAATFNTPIAAVILAIELVLFERSLRTIVPLLIACSIAAAIHVVAFGPQPLFAVHAVLQVGFAQLPWFLLVGLASGVLAVVLNKGLFLVEAGFRRLPVGIFWWPMIGALAFSTIGFFVPRTLSMGYSAIMDTLNGHFVVGTVAVLLVAKLIAWWIALGSQTSGGTLAPMFLVGALMGSLLGSGMAALFPGAHIPVAAFALAAMAATFGASTKALFAAVVFALEVTGEYQMAIPLLIATAVADLVAQVGLSDRLMTEKLSHRGFRVDFDTVTDPLRMRLVRHLVRRSASIAATATAAQARRALAEEGIGALPVAGPHGRYLGLITAGDLEGADPDAPAHALAGSAPAPVASGDFLDQVLDRIGQTGLDALPVVDDGILSGVAVGADILAYRHRARTEAEERQPGWASLRRARARAAATAHVGTPTRLGIRSRRRAERAAPAGAPRSASADTGVPRGTALHDTLLGHGPAMHDSAGPRPRRASAEERDA